jgi:hypothetical protein
MEILQVEFRTILTQCFIFVKKDHAKNIPPQNLQYLSTHFKIVAKVGDFSVTRYKN